jgi:hypothetical protein
MVMDIVMETAKHLVILVLVALSAAALVGFFALITSYSFF